MSNKHELWKEITNSRRHPFGDYMSELAPEEQSFAEGKQLEDLKNEWVSWSDSCLLQHYFCSENRGVIMPVTKRIEFNHAAPDITLLNTSGEPVRLSSLWVGKPLLLAFTRHFGCTQCKEMLEELVSGKERIIQAGLGIAVIMQGTPEATAVFAEMYAPGLVCLADPERKAYEAFGLERGGLFQTFLNPRVWSAVSRARKKGYAVEPPPPGQDAMQMSGTFIIGTDGRIELPYYYDHIADHPPLDLLLSGVLSTRWGKSFEGPIGPE